MTLPNYANEASFRVYIDYLALKRHFTTKNYDYHKFNGKVKASIDSLRSRKDLLYFYKLSKKRDYHQILLSHLVKNPNSWIRDIVEDNQIFVEWQKRIESLTYTFKQELSKLDEDYRSNFIVVNGQHPPLMVLYLQKQISLETFTILAHLSNSLDYWETEIVDKIVAGDIINLLRKYYPFLNVDKKKFRQILKDRFF